MWKTPEETKKGLECCYSSVAPMIRCEECPYYGSVVCKMHLHTDTLALIQRLEAERDAAVRDMTEIVQEYGEAFCDYCGADFKPNCTGRCWTHSEGFKWRGVQKEEIEE